MACLPPDTSPRTGDADVQLWRRHRLQRAVLQHRGQALRGGLRHARQLWLRSVCQAGCALPVGCAPCSAKTLSAREARDGVRCGHLLCACALHGPAACCGHLLEGLAPSAHARTATQRRNPAGAAAASAAPRRTAPLPQPCARSFAHSCALLRHLASERRRACYRYAPLQRPACACRHACYRAVRPHGRAAGQGGAGVPPDGRADADHRGAARALDGGAGDAAGRRGGHRALAGRPGRVPAAVAADLRRCASPTCPPPPYLPTCSTPSPAIAARRRCQAGLHRCALGSPRMPA